MEIKHELEVTMALLTSYWETMKSENPNGNTYELSEAICTIAYVIDQLTKGDQQ